MSRAFAIITLCIAIIACSPTGNRVDEPNTGMNGVTFVDQTAAAGLTHSGASSGIAIGDVDGDGSPDIFDTHHGNTPSLYVNRGDGSFVDEVARLDAVAFGDQHGAAWGDADGDGDQDLVVVGGGGNDGPKGAATRLFFNEDGILRTVDGNDSIGTFTDRGRTPLWLDADDDGDLDLLVFNGVRSDGTGPSTLLRNSGGFEPWQDLDVDQTTGRTGFFGIVTRLVGSSSHPILVVHDSSSPIAAYRVDKGLQRTFLVPGVALAKDMVVADLDGDLDADIFVTTASGSRSGVAQTNDRSIDVFLRGRGDGVRFTSKSSPTVSAFGRGTSTFPPESIHIGRNEASPSASDFALAELGDSVDGLTEVADRRSGLSIGRVAPNVWEFTCEGSSDCPVSMRISSADPITDVTTLGFNGSAPPVPDRLWLQNGAGEFVDRTDWAGLSSPSNCITAIAADFDNDMDLDLYLACSGPYSNLPNLLLENDGTGRFSPVADAAGASGTDMGVAATAVVVDVDNDGFLDLYVTNGHGPEPFNNGPVQLFRNSGNDNHWITLDLVGRTSNRDGIGAVVRVTAGGVTQVREKNGGMHRYSQNDQRIHVGLATHSVIERIEVRWPSGQSQVLEDVRADQFLTIEEPHDRSS